MRILIIFAFIICCFLAWSFFGFLIGNISSVAVYLYSGYCCFLSGVGETKRELDEKIFMFCFCLILWPLVPVGYYIFRDRTEKKVST